MQKRRVLVGLVSAATVAALMVPGAAFAKGPGSGGGGGGGGEPEEETVSHSLSVPTVFVGSNTFGLTCDGTAVDPDEVSTNVAKTGYPVNESAYYYVQGDSTWQAGCLEDFTEATATVAWGDNLAGGSAKLRVGMPIRVEIGLFLVGATDPLLTGWEVIKLEPAELDRLAAYGTLAVGDTTNGFTSVPVTPYLPTRVWASGAMLTITDADGIDVIGGPIAASAEINATGKVVYGYNLRVKEAGEYTIAYYFPGVTLTGTPNAGELVAGDLGDTASLTITVGSGGGGGGGRPTR